MCQICGYQTLGYFLSTASTSGAGNPGAVSDPQYGGGGANFLSYQGANANVNINGVLSGSKWGGSVLSYSFPTSASQYESGYSETTNNFMAAPEATKVAIRYAMNLLSQYTNMTTTEVSGSTSADVRVAFSDSANPTAYAYYPSDSTKGGDIWYGSNYTEYQNPIKGQYAWATTIHELGHALGLKHGHETGGPANTAVQTAYDQMAYTVMTYRSYQGGPLTGYTNETNGYAQTFMMYDIAALQAMYGANFNTNSGNTTYSWNATTGEMSINDVGQGAPGGNRIFMTLWDGNGVDTYDFSNYSSNLTVNLAPGAFSITSSAQLAYLGNSNYAPGNIFNVLQYNGDTRSLIENANGGSGNDSITGNAANNTLHGNNGNDTILGGDGNDILYGDAGADSLNSGNGDDTIYFDASDTSVQGGAGYDLAVYTDATTGLRSYDMASHGLEALRWTNSGDTYTLYLNSDGTRLEVHASSSPAQTFSTISTSLDASLRVTSATTLNKDGSRAIFNYDYLSNQDYTELRYYYHANSRLDYTDVRYDDGTQVVTSFDAAEIIDYRDARYLDGTRVVIDYDSLGRTDYRDAHFADGTRIVTDYDLLDRVDYRDTRYVDGTRRVTDEDNNSDHTWHRVITYYDALARTDTNDTYYDDNTRLFIDYDQANAFAWSEHRITYNASGGIVSDVYL